MGQISGNFCSSVARREPCTESWCTGGTSTSFTLFSLVCRRKMLWGLQANMFPRVDLIFREINYSIQFEVKLLGRIVCNWLVTESIWAVFSDPQDYGTNEKHQRWSNGVSQLFWCKHQRVSYCEKLNGTQPSNFLRWKTHCLVFVLLNVDEMYEIERVYRVCFRGAEGKMCHLSSNSQI